MLLSLNVVYLYNVHLYSGKILCLIYVFLSLQLMATLPKRKLAHKFELPTVRYIILFWQDEQKYEMLPSSSTFFRSGTDPTTLKKGSVIDLKDGSRAKVITNGEDLNDVKKLLERLETRLAKGRLDASCDSFGFLNSTSASQTSEACNSLAQIDEEEGVEEDVTANDSLRAHEENDVSIEDGSNAYTDAEDHQIMYRYRCSYSGHLCVRIGLNRRQWTAF